MEEADSFESSVLFELRALREASARIEQHLVGGLSPSNASPSLCRDDGAGSTAPLVGATPVASLAASVGGGALPPVVGNTSQRSLFGGASSPGGCIVASPSSGRVRMMPSGGRQEGRSEGRQEKRRSARATGHETSGRSEAISNRITEMTGSKSESSQAVLSVTKRRFVAWSLPLGWPGVLKMRSELYDEDEAASPSPTAVRRFANDIQNRKSSAEVNKEAVRTSRRSVGRHVINPNSRFHMTYSLSSLVILFFDLTVLPFVLAWEVDFDGALYVFSWMTPVFWSFDIWVNFMTGIYRDGDVVMDPWEIARAYGKTWFVPDAVVVVCDWVSLILGEVLESADTSRSLKMLRFCKMGRLLRIVGVMRMLRVVRILEEFAALYLTEGYRLMFRMVNLTVSILWTAHLLACFWFAVGRAAPSDTGNRWTTQTNVRMGDAMVGFFEAPVMYQYMVSFHWAAGQIALGSIDVTPTNSVERMVFVLTMMIGFLFGSTLVSMLSAAMMDYQMMKKDITMKLRLLRQYLRENEVPALVSVLVQKQVEQRLQERERLNEHDVNALGLLSVTLRSQLRFEIQQPHLTGHPLFRLWISMDIKLMHRTCMKAVNFLNMRPRDDLFSPGGVATCAYALVTGELHYTQSPDSSPVEAQAETIVEPKSWMCEAALWVDWTHVGKAESTSECSLLSIEAMALSECLQQDFIIREVAMEYCRQFHKRVRSACPPHADYPTDLHVPFTDFPDLVASMEKQVQVAIGREALGQLALKKGQGMAQQLQEEVDASKSILVVTAKRDIIRVVSLVALRAVQADGRVFMQVGKWEGGTVKSTWQLPGTKQEADELIGETLERMFATKLTLLDGKLDITGAADRITEEKESKEFRVQTRYSRFIYHARLLPDATLDAMVVGVREVSDEENDRMAEELTAPGNNAQNNQLLRTLQSIEVFAVPAGKGTGNLYAWIPAEWEKALSEKILQRWISSLAVPDVNADIEGHLHVIL